MARFNLIDHTNVVRAWLEAESLEEAQRRFGPHRDWTVVPDGEPLAPIYRHWGGCLDHADDPFLKQKNEKEEEEN